MKASFGVRLAVGWTVGTIAAVTAWSVAYATVPSAIPASGWDQFVGFASAALLGAALGHLVVRRRIGPAALFVGTWYGALAASRLLLSPLQASFGATQALLLFVAPSTFALGAVLGASVPTLKAPRLATQHMQWVERFVAGGYLLATAALVAIRGPLLLMEDWGQARLDYAVPFLSMFHEGLAFLTVALFARRGSPRAWVGFGVAVTGNVLSYFSRGNIFRYLLTVVIARLSAQRQAPQGLRGRRSRLVVAVVLAVALFGFLGNLRYWGGFDIAEYVGIDSRLSSLVWAYVYIATPYDLAAIAMRDTDPVGLPLAFMGPPLKLLQLDNVLESLGGEPQEFSVRGINSVGGLALFIHDYGTWFWIEWALFGAMIGYLWRWAENRGQLGAAGLVLAMVFLLFFDSALLRPQIIGAILLATIIGRENREEKTPPDDA